MVTPGYLDPSTVEWCERCRCKTWHTPSATGERICEWAEQHVTIERRPVPVAAEQYPDEGSAYDEPLEVKP